MTLKTNINIYRRGSVHLAGVRCGSDEFTCVWSESDLGEKIHTLKTGLCLFTIHDVMLGTGGGKKNDMNMLFNNLYIHLGTYRTLQTGPNETKTRLCIYEKSVRSILIAAVSAYKAFLNMKLIFLIQMIVESPVPELHLNHYLWTYIKSLKYVSILILLRSQSHWSVEIKREKRKRKPDLFLCVSMLHESLSSNFNQCVETRSLVCDHRADRTTTAIHMNLSEAITGLLFLFLICTKCLHFTSTQCYL